MSKVLKAGWLVGAAARKAMGGAVMAAALVLGMTACSSDDGVTESGEPQAAAPQAVSTVHVTVGAGIGDNSGAQTRSNVEYNEEAKSRRLVFTAGDRLFVSAFVDDSYFVAGTLSIVNSTISEDGREASFSGDLKVYQYVDVTPVPSEYAFETDDPLNECEDYTADLIPKDMSNDCYTIEDYRILQFDHSKSIVEDNPEDESDDCVSTLMKTAIKVSSTSYKIDDYGEGPKMFRQFEGSPILNCEISGLTGGTAYTVTVLADGDESNYNNYISTDYNLTYATPVTADGNGTARFAIGLKEGFSSVSYWTLKFESISGETRYLKLGMRDAVDSNKAYRVSGTATGRTIDLTSAKIEPDENGQPHVKARDGDVLTGSNRSGYYVAIAAGATVTLSDVNLDVLRDCEGANIHCLGSANIILSGSGENIMRIADGRKYPAIYVPSGKTVTISGQGSINIESRAGNSHPACIGGGQDIDCGNIVITGGTITATSPSTEAAAIGSGGSGGCGNITISGGTINVKGGSGAAAIGAGRGGSCGDITISGGTVTATGGYQAGAGIGTGYKGRCGDITISGGTVEATGGYNAAGIGCGKDGSCGNITISGGFIKATKGGGDDHTSNHIGKNTPNSTCGTVTVDPSLFDTGEEGHKTRVIGYEYY